MKGRVEETERMSEHRQTGSLGNQEMQRDGKETDETKKKYFLPSRLTVQ